VRAKEAIEMSSREAFMMALQYNTFAARAREFWGIGGKC
jgi:hypothetical protein